MVASISLLTSVLVVAFILLRSSSNKQVFVGLLSFVIIIELNRINSTALLVGSQEIGIEDFPLAVLAFVALLCISRDHRVPKPLFVMAVILYAISIASLSVNILFPSDTLVVSSSWDEFYLGTAVKSQAQIGLKSVLSLLRLLIFLFIMCAAAAIMRKKDYVHVGETFLLVSKLHIGFALFELASKYIFGSGISLVVARSILPDYGQSVVTIVFQRGELYALQGFTREPAHFAMAMFFFVVMFVLVKRITGVKSRTEYIWPVAAFVLMIASASFSSIVFLVAIAFTIVISRRRTVRTRFSHAFILGVTVVICLGTVLLLTGSNIFADTFYGEKLKHMIESMPAILTGDYTSIEFMRGGGVSRLISIVETLRVFLQNPLLGVGPGVSDASSGMVSIMANYGLAGTGAWIAFLLLYAWVIDRSKVRVYVGFVLLYALFLGGENTMYSSLWVLSGGLFAYLPLLEGVGHQDCAQQVELGAKRQGLASVHTAPAGIVR